MNKITLPVTESGYSIVEGNEALFADFGSGRTNFRAGKDGLVSRVKVQWTLDRTSYTTFRTFYSNQGKGSIPFLIDLLMDQSTLTEHVASFVPGSITLQAVDGLTYIVSAELAVAPIWDPGGYAVTVHNYSNDLEITLLSAISHFVHTHLATDLHS